MIQGDATNRINCNNGKYLKVKCSLVGCGGERERERERGVERVKDGGWGRQHM